MKDDIFLSLFKLCGIALIILKSFAIAVGILITLNIIFKFL